MTRKRFVIILGSSIFCLIVFSILYLMLGDKDYYLTDLSNNPIVLQLRLPRLLSLYLVGFLLSTSGFLVQIMTKNPIAEMTTLGISGGSSLALSLLLTLGFSTTDGLANLVASSGALITLLVVILLTAKSHFQPLKVVLVGTSIGLFTTSLASAVTFATNHTQSYFLWIVGSFSGMTIAKLQLLAIVSFIFVSLILLFGNQIKMLDLGDEMAKTLGLSVNQIRFLIMFLVALASGVTIASVGVISFVGLIAPHIAKKFTHHHFWQTLVLSTIIGIFLLLLSDLVARNLVLPYELPVGSLTLLFGAPFFLWIITKEAK